MLETTVYSQFQFDKSLILWLPPKEKVELSIMW